MAKRLGELLVEKNIVTKEQLDLAVEEHNRTSEFLGKILIDMKLITEDQLLKLLSEQMKISYIDLKKVEVQEEAIKRVPGKLVWDYRFIPIKIKKETLSIAIGNPHNAMVFDKLRTMIGIKLEINLAKQDDIDRLISKHYTSLADTIEKLLSVEE